MVRSGGFNFWAVATTTNNRLLINFDTSSTDSLIEADKSKDYVLRPLSVTNLTAANTESVSIQLNQDTTTPSYLATGTLMGSVYSIQNSASSSDSFIWTPFSTSSAPTVLTTAMQSNADWTNSYGLPGYPSTGQRFPLQTFGN